MNSNGNKSYWVEFIGDRSLQTKEGQTILEASLEAGIPHYHACGGNAQCSTCRVLIEQGSEHLTPYNEKEKALRERIPIPNNMRLACQTFVIGSPVHLHRIIRDEEDIKTYVDDATLGADEEQLGMDVEMALFFLDIREFTPFMQNYLPFDVIHILRRLFTLFRKSIEEHQGRVIETAGDGLYAVFGLAKATKVKEAANQAVAAATTILDRLEEFNAQYLEKHFNHHAEVGIGVHAGRVIVGNVGLGVNNNLTVMGLPVNIASRLQAITRKVNNSIVVSETVYQLLDGTEPVPTANIHLKGVEGTFKVYLLGRPYTQ